MAVAGLCKVSTIGHSHVTGQWGDTTYSAGQGSDDGDHISEYSDGVDNQGLVDSGTENDDGNSIISEQSSDMGEVERERVRQIFREWMNSGSKDHPSYKFHGSKPQLLGENEHQRVRIIREWVQMNTQQRKNQGSVRGDFGSQIEQVRDGLAISHPEVGAQRPIRRLCGRQTLHDLVLRAQSERKIELQRLSELRPVSDFPHGNRIRMLLKGMFLRNKRLISDERSSSVAAAELRLLRQRSTVSDLREGFLSKLDNCASTSANSDESDSSFDDVNNGESDLEFALDGNKDMQEFDMRAIEAEDVFLHNDESDQEVLLGAGNDISREEPVLKIEARRQDVSDVCGDPYSRHGEQINTSTNGSLSKSETIIYSVPLHVCNDNYESRSSPSCVGEGDGLATDLERRTYEEFDHHDTSTQVEEFQEPAVEIEASVWQQLNSVTFTEWADHGREDADESWEESQWFRETSDNFVDEQEHRQESQEDWPGHNFQEVIDSWLSMPAGEVGTSMGGFDAFSFPEDDNVNRMELRELLSRRRVSNLLCSSFREALDQVLRSHAERLGRASGDWELDYTYSSPALVEQDIEQQNGDQISALSDGVGTEGNPSDPSLNLVAVSQTLWDEELQGANLPHHSNQQLGTEWDVINEMRLDIARLHLRMDNMQSMLEACMDMQMELQRSVRQEVSAALNRSVFSRDAEAVEDNQPHADSQWDYLRKGICCLCGSSKIDSLLYRCGHMCTCLKCAENLVRCMGKCPMCQALAIDMVRAYFV